MRSELDREAALAQAMIYKSWALAGGEGGKQMADNAGKAYESYLGLTYPWQANVKQNKEKQQLKVLEKFMRAFGVGQVVDEAQTRASDVTPENPRSKGSMAAQKLKDMFTPKKKET